MLSLIGPKQFFPLQESKRLLLQTELRGLRPEGNIAWIMTTLPDRTLKLKKYNERVGHEDPAMTELDHPTDATVR